MNYFSHDRLKQFAPTFLRIGISLVYLWFGSQQLLHTSQWVRLIPESVVNLSGLSAATLVQFNGGFEIVFALALLVGFYTRFSALLLGLHMFSIISVVGYGPTGVRDFGIAVGTLAVAFQGAGGWSVDEKIQKKAEEVNQ